ncbi:MAG: hypothetical protein KF868_10400 [Acidobacteria bacterium]|nr:hypothetical protein [Acidobacteriota bacterium]
MRIERPQFELTRVYADGTKEAPEIVPVAHMPAGVQMNRRGVLGVGIGTAAALFLLDSAARAGGGDEIQVAGQQTPEALKEPESPLPAHVNEISALALAPDGGLLVSGSRDNSVKFWAFPEGRWLQTLPAHPGDVNTLAITPDGRMLITVCADALRLWSLPAGQLQSVLDAHTGEIRAIAVSGDGKLLVSAGEDRTIRFWSLPEGRLLTTIEGLRGAVQSLALTPNGRMVVAGGQEVGLKLWSAPDGRLLTTLGRFPAAFAITPDGESIALCLNNIELRSLADGRLLSSMESHRGVSAATLTPDGKILITAGQNNFTFWSLPEVRLLRSIENTGVNVVRLACSPDGRMFLSWGGSAGARLWSLPEGQLLSLFQTEVRSAIFSAKERTLVTGQSRGTLANWNLNPTNLRGNFSDPALDPGKPPDKMIKAHAAGITSLAVSADGKTLVSAAGIGYGAVPDSTKLWSLPDGKLTATLENHKEGTTAVAVTPDGRTFITSGNDKAIRLWSLPEERPPAATSKKPAGQSRTQPARPAPPAAAIKGRLVAALEGHQAGVRKLYLSADSLTLISTDAFNTVMVRALPEGRVLSEISDPKRELVVLAPSSDGTLLATTTSNREDQTVKIWSLPSGQLQLTLAGHRGKVQACAIAPDNRLLATSAADNETRLWELPGGRLLGALETLPGLLAFSPDGRFLATSSSRESIRIWSASEGRLLMTLEDARQQGYTGNAGRMLFTPNGGLLLSVAGNGDINLWSLDEGRLLAILRGQSMPAEVMVVTPDSKTLACGYNSGVIALWDLEKPGFRGFLFDAAVNTTEVKGITYNVYDQVTGRTVTYTLPCGSPIPPGAVCTCNCVPGTYRVPTYSGGGGVRRTGRTICTCNRVCTCIPVPSDRDAKEAFEAVDPVQILECLSELPIQTWNYKWNDAAIRHIGPMAQDFAATFAVGEDDKHICPVDAQGVALAAIQGLYRIVQEKEAQLSDQRRLAEGLQDRLRLQEEMNREMRARIEALERRLLHSAMQSENDGPPPLPRPL